MEQENKKIELKNIKVLKKKIENLINELSSKVKFFVFFIIKFLAN